LRAVSPSGDVWWAAVAAQRQSLQAGSPGQRWPTAALAARRTHPADQARTERGVDATARGLTAATPSSAAWSGSRSRKRYDHAHDVTFQLLHWLCQTQGFLASAGIIGRMWRRAAETSVP